MAGLAHIYLTAHGEWKAGTPWVGEKAQIGVRIFTELTASAPVKGAVFEPSIGGDVETVSVAYSGTNGTLSQNWSALGGNPVTGFLWNDAAQAGLAEDMRTFLDSIKAYTSANFNWTHMKIAPILASGAYGAPSSVYQLTTALSGTGTAANTQPPELSVCVSFRAPILGRRGRGRFYLPAITTSWKGDNGLVDSTVSTNTRTAAKTLIDNLQNLAGGPFTYMPIVGVSSAGATTAVRPFDVRIGNHFDVQKRRQDQVSEVYSVTNL